MLELHSIRNAVSADECCRNVFCSMHAPSQCAAVQFILKYHVELRALCMLGQSWCLVSAVPHLH
jgi:hypothetical protein